MLTNPPSPPHIPPKLRMHRSEKFGLPLLFLLPLLAVIGVFGPKTGTAEARSGDVRWTVEHPSVTRYQHDERLIVRVSNRGPSPVAGVRVAFAPDYIHSFSAVAFDPASSEQPYLVDIGDLGAGESRLVSVQLTARDYGRRRGWVELYANGERSRADLSTFVFP